MAQKEFLITPEGKAKLEEELHHLKSVRRQEVAEKIQRAIERGGTDHNAEYEDAKNEQAFVEGRILTLENLLKNAVVVTPEKGDRVKIGSRVSVLTQDGKPETFTIVGVAEADPSQGKISHQSPVGQALLGKRVGDEVEVKVPAGTLRFTVTGID